MKQTGKMKRMGMVKRMGVVCMVGGGLWLFGVEPLHAQIVRCTGPDGTFVYTNAATSGWSKCVSYESRVELGFVSGKGPVEQSSLYRSAPEKPAKPTFASTRAVPKEVSFETFRMLSTGMSKAEVLRLAGSPRHEFKNKGTNRWVYDATDRWVVEIVFSGNKVAAIDWTRA